MLEVAKMSLSELRHTAGLPNAGFPEVARILFDGNAKIASRTFGSRSEGFKKVRLRI